MVLAWHKPQARPQKGRDTQNCEFIVWTSNGPIDAARNPVYLPGLYSASQPSGKARRHITQKPVSVMRELVQIAPEGGTADRLTETLQQTLAQDDLTPTV